MRGACRGGTCQHAVEASLRRLGIDVIDLLYLHKEDHATPLAETVHALADLIRAGKIRYFGVSNYRSWRVAEMCRLCDQAGIDRPVASQPLYNALNREVGNGALAGVRVFRAGRGAVQPAGARGADREIRAGRDAAGRKPGRAGGTGACWNRNGGRKVCRSRGRSPTMRGRRA